MRKTALAALIGFLFVAAFNTACFVGLVALIVYIVKMAWTA